MNFLDREDPELVIGSSSWDVSDFLKGSSRAMENQTDLHVCAGAYARQHQRGKVFLHEAPIRSITWKNRDISWITLFPEVFKIKGPICRWKVCKGDVNSVGYIRQAICWMTNDGRLAQTLADQRDGGSGEWIREASFAGGIDRSGAISPPNLVTAVLKAIKRNVLDQQVISAVELQSGGPTAELPELWNQPDYKEYWDDVNGGFLDPRLVREARLLELDWIKKERVYDYRSRTEAEKKGIKPIPLIWVDILLREHGLDDSRSKGVDTPRVKKSEYQVFAGLESPPLDREGVRLYRSGAMRISYLGQDRADVQEAAKCLSRLMQSPTQADLVELKRAVRYLLKFPRAVLVFDEQELARELNGWVDTDFAGELVSRRSSSGLVLLFGRHCLKTSSSVQEPIGLSSGESEFYACVKGWSSVAGNAVIDDGLGSLIQIDSEDSNGLQCGQGFRNQAWLGAPETCLHSFPLVAGQSEQGRVESCESWHNRPIGGLPDQTSNR